jgi:hypothetical protein
MLVVDPLAPAVPMLIDLVLPLTVAPVAKLYVLGPPVDAVNMFTTCEAVAVLPMPRDVALLANVAVVAALNALTVNKLVLNNVSVPVLVLDRVGLTPLTFIAVALPSVSVTLLILAVPVAAPIDNVVAAPAKLTVVAVVFNKLKLALSVSILVVTVGLVLNRTLLVPVSSVIADAKLADVGVARNVATPVPKLLISAITPALNTGRPAEPFGAANT